MTSPSSRIAATQGGGGGHRCSFFDSALRPFHTFQGDLQTLYYIHALIPPWSGSRPSGSSLRNQWTSSKGMQLKVRRSSVSCSKLISALAFDHLNADARPPMTLYSFDSALPPVSGPSDLSKGSDIDIGGFTDSTFTMVPASSSSTFTPPPTSPTSTSGEEVVAGPSMSHLAFHGKMSLVIPRGQEGKIRPGYAGMRNRRRLHLFGEDMWDLSRYSHLKLVLAYRGWEGWRNRWYCNVQVDGTQV